MVAGGVLKPTRKPMAKLKLALFWLSASAPMAMLKLPVVLLKCPGTNRHVIKAVGIVSKRIDTHGGIVDSRVD